MHRSLLDPLEGGGIRSQYLRSESGERDPAVDDRAPDPVDHEDRLDDRSPRRKKIGRAGNMAGAAEKLVRAVCLPVQFVHDAERYIIPAEFAAGACIGSRSVKPRQPQFFIPVSHHAPPSGVSVLASGGGSVKVPRLPHTVGTPAALAQETGENFLENVLVRLPPPA